MRCGHCDEKLIRLAWRPGGLRPIFTAEWRRGDDDVWRLTSYARHQRIRRADGKRSALAGSAIRRVPWSEPARWKPIVPELPCQAECDSCGSVLLIRR